MLAARRAGGDAVVDGRALGRGVPREPGEGDRRRPAASPNGRAVGEGRGVGLSDVAAVVSRARRRRAGAGAAARAGAGRARGAAGRRAVGAVGRARRAGSCSLVLVGVAAAASRGVARRRRRRVAVVAGRRRPCWRVGRSRRLRAAGCCTRCACGGRGRGRRSTRASRRVRSGARACWSVDRVPAGDRAARAGAAWAVGRRARGAPRAAGRVPARARGARAARSAGRGARRACCWCGAIRSRTPRRCAWPAADAERAVAVGADPGRRRRAGRAGGDRAGRAQRADRRRAGRGQVGRRCRRCSPRRRSIRTRGSGCSTASSSSSRRGRRSRSGVAGPNGEEALALLREVRAEMDERYRELLARGLRKVRREDGLPLHLVVCDELAFYLTLPDKAAAPGVRRAAARPRRSRSRGRRDRVRGDAEARRRRRAVGAARSVRVPAGDAVHTPQASDTILGQGWASAGADASTIPGAQRGVGYLLAEGERPIRMRGLLPRRRRRARRSPSAPPRARADDVARAGRGVERHDGAIAMPRAGPGARRACSSARPTRTSGSASSASCARPATAGGRSGCAAGSTRSTSRPARS